MTHSGKFQLGAPILLLLGSVPMAAQNFKVLWPFASQYLQGSDANLVQGKDGNFYGTTASGGDLGAGTFFEMTPAGSFTVLYSFGTAGSVDSSGPNPIIQASDGNFYGTTNQSSNGGGSVFELTPGGSATTLVNFSRYAGGSSLPEQGVIQGSDGNFYGITVDGGSHNGGTIYRMTPDGTVTVLYNFSPTETGIYDAVGTLVQGPDGNLYGTLYSGGIHNTGSVYKLTLSGTLTTLYSFGVTESNPGPPGPLVVGADGNLYGATRLLSDGINYSPGTIYRITTGGTLTTLYTIPTQSTHADPNSLIQGADGNLYGTTTDEANDGTGSIFEVTLGGAYSTLYSFNFQTDGDGPTGIIQGSDGNLYGTTSSSGPYGEGVIYRLTLAPAGSSSATVTSVVNAFSTSPTIAPNTWVAIKGSGLAPAGDSRIWQSSDFTGNQMPTSLDGVSVSMNGEPAYVYYISPTQLNILTPPDLATGPVQITVTNNGSTSASFTAQAQADSLAFFVFNGGPYVIGTHLNGSDLGPTSLYPGTTTPAQPGEVIVLYGSGFGAVSPAVSKGSAAQSGNLPTLPVIQIGGIAATVQFAGLVSPGLYQFNVVVPQNAASGDNSLVAQYNGLSTQSGVLLTIGGNNGPQVQSLTLSATSVASGSTIQGTVTLSTAAPSGGIVVSLSSNSSAATVPGTVTVAAGATSASFTMTGVSASPSVTITASYQGSSAQATVTVTASGTTGGSFPQFTVLSVSAQISGNGSTETISIDLEGYDGQVLDCILAGSTPFNLANTSAYSFEVVWSSATVSGSTVTCTGFAPTSTWVLGTGGQAEFTSGSLSFTVSPQVVNTSGTVSGNLNLVSTLLTISSSFAGTYTAH